MDERRMTRGWQALFFCWAYRRSDIML